MSEAETTPERPDAEAVESTDRDAETPSHDGAEADALDSEVTFAADGAWAAVEGAVAAAADRDPEAGAVGGPESSDPEASDERVAGASVDGEDVGEEPRVERSARSAEAPEPDGPAASGAAGDDAPEEVAAPAQAATAGVDAAAAEGAPPRDAEPVKAAAEAPAAKAGAGIEAEDGADSEPVQTAAEAPGAEAGVGTEAEAEADSEPVQAAAEAPGAEAGAGTEADAEAASDAETVVEAVSAKGDGAAAEATGDAKAPDEKAPDEATPEAKADSRPAVEAEPASPAAAATATPAAAERDPETATAGDSETAATGDSEAAATGDSEAGTEPAAEAEAKAQSADAAEGKKKKKKRKRKSRKRASLPPGPEDEKVVALRAAQAEATPVEGKVIGWNNGGFHVVIDGLTAFCPRSEMEVGNVRTPKSYLDKELTFQILKVQERGRRVVLSRAGLLKQQRREQKRALRDKLEPGSLHEGRVASVTDFGAFVELGGLQGLVHVSELSRDHVGHPSEVVEVGQKVTVKVLKVEQGGKRISLSMKALEPDPWDGVAKRFSEGAVVKGVVEKTAQVGAFVALEPGLTGLLPTSTVSLPRGSSLARMYPPGKEVSVQIRRLDPRRRRISLAPEGSQTEGTRSDLESFRKSASTGQGFNALAAALEKARQQAD